jgi:D-alanyl-D-alanine dipeptidase
MPIYSQHTEQAEHNRELLRFFVQQDEQVKFSDWYVTVAFYSALHYFEAMLFSVKPVVPAGGVAVEHSDALCGVYRAYSTHRARDLAMRSLFQQIYAPYSALYRMSRTARYNCYMPGKHDWKRAETLLDSVKKECETLIRNKK